ncbi:MAG: adenylyltransferase/cytidyltransferase family protein [Clostridium sp.]|nr:adenylyltransferase/cytidyltransferase family protein [Clostridium sp.]MCM1207420.1 adenylyltransferase/cytidyltransferase family protein [Ruminococcus sp.]
MKKIITFGVFDYFHLGHLRLFKQCKKYADYLIVAVQDGDCILKYKPETTIFYSTDERIELLTSIREIDEVITYKNISIETLEGLDFNILALGEDHIGERFDRVVSWCNNNGKEVVRLQRTPRVSSSKIKTLLL